MPKRDQTGPEGQGPGTGRGMGNCPKARNFSSMQNIKNVGRAFGNCARVENIDPMQNLRGSGRKGRNNK